MSDVADGSGPVPRRAPRTADGGAPVSGALAIVLAVIAVVAGFFILRSISGDEEKQFDLQSAGTGAPARRRRRRGVDDHPALDGGDDHRRRTTTTIVVDGATVVVANANGIGGSAATMSTALGIGPGFTMGDPIDASDADGDLETRSSTTTPPSRPPRRWPSRSTRPRRWGDGAAVARRNTAGRDGDISGAGVLVMLGLDKANKTLEELNPTTNTAPVVVTNPPLTSGTDSRLDSTDNDVIRSCAACSMHHSGSRVARSRP